MSDNQLSALYEAAQAVHQATRRLHDSIDRQMEAVRLSDALKVEELAEGWTSILTDFKQAEQRLILEINRLIPGRTAAADRSPDTNARREPQAGESAEAALPRPNGQGVRLSELASRFPEAAGEIANWRILLETGVEELLRKHRKLTGMLEFAIDQNSRLMRSVYELSNRDSSHYGPDGRPGEVKPGTAVNHKV